MTAPHVELRDSFAPELSTNELYGLLRLRSEVLIVEQQSAYQDLDGRDLLTGTRHVWAESNGDVVACARLTEEGTDAVRMGRICTAHHARGRGVARRVVTRALELASDKAVVTSVQSHLAPWYETFGFVPTGPMFHEVGIPHMPMRLEPKT